MEICCYFFCRHAGEATQAIVFVKTKPCVSAIVLNKLEVPALPGVCVELYVNTKQDVYTLDAPDNNKQKLLELLKNKFLKKVLIKKCTVGAKQRLAITLVPYLASFC